MLGTLNFPSLNGYNAASLTGNNLKKTWYFMFKWWICVVYWHPTPYFESSIASRYGTVTYSIRSSWAITIIIIIIINLQYNHYICLHHYNFYYDCHCYYFHHNNVNRQTERQPNNCTRLQVNTIIWDTLAEIAAIWNLWYCAISQKIKGWNSACSMLWKYPLDRYTKFKSVSLLELQRYWQIFVLYLLF